MTNDWSKLCHAYGSAEDVPGLIDAWSHSPSAEILGDLFGRLVHQGTIYSASYPAIPLLIGAREVQTMPEHRREMLHLVACILASNDCAGFTRPERQVWPDLVAVTEAHLGDADVEDSEFVHLLCAIAAFRGDDYWAHT